MSESIWPLEQAQETIKQQAEEIAALKAELAKKPVDAVECLSAAFKADPDYAHSWHCNIAMAMYDELTPTTPNSIDVCNRAATRFMKNVFGVDTAQEQG